MHRQGLPNGVLFILGDAVTELAGMAQSGPIDAARPDLEYVDQREPDGVRLAVDDRFHRRADLVRGCHQVIERPLLSAPRVEYQKALLVKARLVGSPTRNRILRRRLQTVCRAIPKVPRPQRRW